MPLANDCEKMNRSAVDERWIAEAGPLESIHRLHQATRVDIISRKDSSTTPISSIIASRPMQRSVNLRHVVGSFSTTVTVSKLPLRYAATRTAAARRAVPPPKAAKPVPAPRTGIPLPYALVSGAFAAAIAFYGGSLLVAASKRSADPAVAILEQQKDVSGVYDTTAADFDGEVGFSEMLMGVNKMRKSLAQQCTGHVLEVSCGTGRNLSYYDIYKKGHVESLTFVDLSPQMVDVCKRKWDILMGKKQNKLNPSLTVRFLPASALGAMPLAPTSPTPRKYDTVIQTMGLCSTPSPVELLANMVQYLDTDNPDSRILLLEHGRSYRQWLNNILDNSAEKHAEIHGCWFNRDIGALVEEAAQKTGLEVVTERRFHLGTTWVFELKPKTKAPAVDTDADSATTEKQKSWLPWKG